jgi:hypothetical protein
LAGSPAIAGLAPNGGEGSEKVKEIEPKKYDNLTTNENPGKQKMAREQ